MTRLLLLLLLLAACTPARPGGSSDDDDSASDDDDAADDDDATADDDDATGDDDDATGDDDDATGDDDDTPPLTIADLNAGAVPEETQVTLANVTVTSPPLVDEDDGNAFFWVQDGEQRGDGIVVYTFPEIVEVHPEIAPGQSFSIEATYRVPFDFPELYLDSASDLVHLGASSPMTPLPISASEIDGGVTSDPNLVGMLVRITGAEVDTAPSWANYGTWEADGVYVESAWAEADVEVGYDVDLTGIVHRSFGDVVLRPRAQVDLDFEHPGCGAWTSPSDPRALNCREVAPGTQVTVSNLVVNSPAPFYGDAFYAQMEGGNPFGGLQIFSAGTLAPPPIGSIVTVSGVYEEYRFQSEIMVDPADVIVTGSTSLEPVLVLDLCSLDEGHEGLLIWSPFVPTEPQSGDAEAFGYAEVDGCPHVHIDGQFFASASDFNAQAGNVSIEDLVAVVSESFGDVRVSPRGPGDWSVWD